MDVVVVAIVCGLAAVLGRVQAGLVHHFGAAAAGTEVGEESGQGGRSRVSAHMDDAADCTEGVQEGTCREDG